MNGTLTTQTQRYLDAVRAHLADLPQQEREDLLEDLEQHLDEVAAEADGSFEDRLGSPADYAAELRASAGLEGRQQSRMQTLLTTQLQRLSALPHPDPIRGLRTLADELRPGWWVLRGYLLLVGWQILFDSRNHQALPIPRVADSPHLGLLAVVLVATGSVWIGRRRHFAARAAGLILTSIAVVSALMAFARVNTAMGAGQDFSLVEPNVVCEGGACYETSGSPGGLGETSVLGRDGRPITNIYAYGPDGTPLQDVRLFDQRGKPITIVREATAYGRPIVTSYPVDLLGNPVTNAFPQQQAVGSDGSTNPIPPPTIDVRPLGDLVPANGDDTEDTRSTSVPERERERERERDRSKKQ